MFCWESFILTIWKDKIEGVQFTKLIWDLKKFEINFQVEQNETEINLQLAIPVVTSSLVVQFAELYESRTPPTELHCPR